MTLRTLHYKVLIKRAETPKKIGLLAIPEAARVPPNEGEVMAIGSNVQDVKVGDKVSFVKSAGKVVKIDDEELLIMEETDIHGVLENNTLRPIGSKVLLLPDPPDEKIGRIEIPKYIQKDVRDREGLISATLVAMGLGMRTRKGGRWPMVDVKIGQRVLYYHNYSPEIAVGGKTYVIVADDQLRAVIEEDQPTQKENPATHIGGPQLTP